MSSPTVTPTLQRLAAPATHDPQRGFTALAHLLDEDARPEAYRHTSQSSAAGIDGVTAKMSVEHRDEHLRDVHARLRRGRSQAAPVERVWSEKDDGAQRPMGTLAFADKIVQRAVAMRLEASDEQDVHACSDGVRPGRRPQAALHAVRERCLQASIGWIVAAEVSGDFDRMDRTRLRERLRQRVHDGRRWRLIGTWLRAGVMENGVRHHPATGVVHGGVISPVLANVFLHHVLDEWFEREVRPRLKGRGFLIRLAADFCIGCEREADARKIRAVRPQRVARLSVTMHPEKTAVIAFGKPDARQASAHGHGTFALRGLTHDGATSRRGCGVIKRRTARKRLRRTMKSRWRWCRAHRHAPGHYQDQRLGLKVWGPCRS